LYDPGTRKIVLLDFGAVLMVDPMIAHKYRRLICVGLQGDTDGLMTAAQDMGLIDATTRDEHRVRIVQIIRQVFDMIRDGGAIDFTDQTLSKQLQAEGLALYKDGFTPPVLPIDILLIQRKFAGLFLLGARLGANVDVADILHTHSKIIR
jgi:predicted unusual protein kinase regulating ubiquinone biosynthesis (AarF/ABC1/UbiB family)